MWDFFGGAGSVIEDAGLFKWPLLACSLLAVFIIVERLLALRPSQILPRRLRQAILHGSIPAQGLEDSAAGRIVAFYREGHRQPEELKAFARLQVTRMERGLFLLDFVISAAPLLGLLGTVTGLVQVFSGISPETGLPRIADFVNGVALALTTTILGLAIAIPALAFSTYLNRRIDSYAALLDVAVERLLAGGSAPAPSSPSAETETSSQ